MQQPPVSPLSHDDAPSVLETPPISNGVHERTGAELRAKAVDVAKSAKRLVRIYPLRAVGTALGAGVALGVGGALLVSRWFEPRGVFTGLAQSAKRLFTR